jgi:hypothetical protein
MFAATKASSGWLLASGRMDFCISAATKMLLIWLLGSDGSVFANLPLPNLFYRGFFSTGGGCASTFVGWSRLVSKILQICRYKKFGFHLGFCSACPATRPLLQRILGRAKIKLF